jgi:hypothetical protein
MMNLMIYLGGTWMSSPDTRRVSSAVVTLIESLKARLHLQLLLRF